LQQEVNAVNQFILQRKTSILYV